jgi:hypothetical protein
MSAKQGIMLESIVHATVSGMDGIVASMTPVKIDALPVPSDKVLGETESLAS